MSRRSFCFSGRAASAASSSWTAGAGFEWAFSDIWSVRFEYDYYGFGTRSVTFIDNVSGTVGPLDIRQNIQVVKLGFNLHVFGQPGARPLGW